MPPAIRAFPAPFRPGRSPSRGNGRSSRFFEYRLRRNGIRLGFARHEFRLSKRASRIPDTGLGRINAGRHEPGRRSGFSDPGLHRNCSSFRNPERICRFRGRNRGSGTKVWRYAHLASGAILIIQQQRVRRNDTANLHPIRGLLHERRNADLSLLSRPAILLLSRPL